MNLNKTDSIAASAVPLHAPKASRSADMFGARKGHKGYVRAALCVGGKEPMMAS